MARNHPLPGFSQQKQTLLDRASKAVDFAPERVKIEERASRPLERIRAWALDLTDEQLASIAVILTPEQQNALRDLLADLFPTPAADETL